MKNKNNNSKQDFGDRILALRTAFGLSQAKLAEALKTKYPSMRVTDSAVHGWEKLGKRPAGEDLLNVAEFFAVEPQWLQFGLSSAKSSDYATRMSEKFVGLTDFQRAFVEAGVDEFLSLNRSVDLRKV